MILFSFILTEKCNWNCKYCQFPYLENPSHTTLKKLDRHLPYILEIKDVLKKNKIPYMFEAQGGEPGLLDYEVFKHFLELINEPVAISTNGLVMKNGFLTKELKPFIHHLMWHLCNEPGDYTIKDYEADIFISRGIVYDNIEEIGKFVGRNSHIQFNYIEMEYDILKERTPSIDDYSSLYTVLNKFTNIDDSVKKKLLDRSKHLGNREDCRRLHSSLMINLASENIMLCQRVPQNNIPLTKENVIKRLTNFPRDIFSGDTTGCFSCTRLYYDKFHLNSIATILKNRRLSF